MRVPEIGRVGRRVGAAVGVVAFVMGVVVVARLVGGTDDATRYRGGEPHISVGIDTSVGDDGAQEPSRNYEDSQEIERAATDFAGAWLQGGLSATDWHGALAARSTKALAASLVGVDPSSVPATRIVGLPSIAVRTDEFAQVTIEVDTGALTLSLLKDRTGWLVDGVDWQRG